MTKVCTKCGEEKSNEEFSKDKSRPDGLSRWCKSCVSINGKKYYIDNKTKIDSKHREYSENNKKSIKEYRKQYNKENNDKRREYNQNWVRQNSRQYLWNKARNRAIDSGIEFNIEVEDIIIPTRCPVFDTELRFEIINNSKGPRSYPNSPSLDRIDNTKGYVKGNIIVMSCRANLLKSDGTVEEFLKLGNFLSNLNNNLTVKEPVYEEDSHYW